MAEEKINNTTQTTPTMDDLSVLRLLLHNIKGISATSTTAAYIYDDAVSDSDA